MVDGFQKLRGKAPVKPVPWQRPASGAAAAAGGSQCRSAGGWRRAAAGAGLRVRR